MASAIAGPEVRGQLSAITRFRWQVFTNSLRTMRGRMEVVSRILVGLMFALFGVGGAIGLAAASYYFANNGKLEYLAFLLWPILLYWQLFPVMATAFTETLDSTHLLRFPLTYPSYFCIRVAMGLLDPVTLVAVLWLLGIMVGTAIAQPSLLIWTAFVLFIFATFNVLLTRMIFAWLERWLAQRRSREIMGVIFLIFIIGVQFIGPLTGRYGSKSKPEVESIVAHISPVQRALPPGLAAASIAQMSPARWPVSVAYIVALGAYLVAIGWFLGVRLRAEYQGENLSEAAQKPKAQAAPRGLHKGWSIFGLPGPLAAMLEKEFRYLLRSGPTLFIMALPLIMLVIFRLNPGASDQHFQHWTGLAFPLGAAYVLLLLTNLSFNSLGGDAAGVQFFFSSPVEFRNVFLGKNLAYVAIIAAQVVVIWIAVCFLYSPPSLAIVLATITGMLFALPIEFSAANLLSIYAPKRIDFGRFGKQRPPQTTVLASFGVHAVVFGIAAIVVFLTRYFVALWLAAPIFLLLAALVGFFYFLLLKRLDQIALARREALITELSKSSAA